MSETNRSMKMFETMDRMRRAWIGLTPMSTLSKSQFRTLLCLYRHGSTWDKFVSTDPYKPMTLSEISARMNQTMPALSQRISKLETMGYVKRIQDQKDKRTVWICLTEDGHRLLVDYYKIMAKKLDDIMGKLGEQDTEEMFRILNQLASIMEDESSADHREE